MKNNKVYFNFYNLRGKIKSRYSREEDFAKALGVSRTTLSLKLNNIRDFTPQEIVRACGLLNIEPKDINLYFFNTEV